MGQVWTFDGAPTTTMGAPSGQVTLLDGTTFCICESSGDLRPGGAAGPVRPGHQADQQARAQHQRARA